MVDKTQQKRFRAIGHKLNPIVTIGGNGFSESVVNELIRALDDHELIKVKIHAEDREDRAKTVAELTKVTGAELIQKVGNVALIYKPAAKPQPGLSNILRSGIL
jgi:RNA-binding protein